MLAETNGNFCEYMFLLVCFGYFVTLFVCLSLDPPYNFLVFSQSLFFVGFLKLSLKTVYPTIGIDGKRYEKIQKDRKRWGKMAAVSENAFFM